ncbi:M28 family peptidase [bacterium]|nr:M28 family peptidase [bacterium]
MQKKKFSISSILVFIICLSFTGCTKAQTPVFNSERAFKDLVAQCDIGYRHPGSPGHSKCLDFMVDALRPLADRVIKQPFIMVDPRTRKSHSLTNVIASFGNQGDRILLCAHWDTRPISDFDPLPENRHKPVMGANDGASGVAILLEMARLFKDNPPPVGVDIVLFDGEDSGLEGDADSWCQGSRYFAQNRMPGYQPRYAVLVDMVGDADLYLPIEINSQRYAPDLVDQLWSLAEQLGLPAFSREDGVEMTDDHLELLKVGIPAIDIIDFDYDYWHTIEDTPDKCSAESLGQVGQLLVTWIYEQ